MLSRKDVDFTPAERIEYERRFNERFRDLADPDNHRYEKIAYVAYMRARREDPELTFDDYLDSLDNSLQLNIEAFGDSSDEEKLNAEMAYERACEEARWCLAMSFPPSEFRMLSTMEQNAYIDVLHERAEEQAKARRKGKFF